MAWLVRVSKRQCRLRELIGDLLFDLMDLVNFSVFEGKKDIRDVLWRPGKGRKIASPGKAGKEMSQHILLSHCSVGKGRWSLALGLQEAPRPMRTKQNLVEM